MWGTLLGGEEKPSLKKTKAEQIREIGTQRSRVAELFLIASSKTSLNIPRLFHSLPIQGRSAGSPYFPATALDDREERVTFLTRK